MTRDPDWRAEYDQGYVRDADQRHHDEAVLWWFVTRDGIIGTFARGGRVATAREARRLIDQAREEVKRDRELAKRLRRPTFVLLPDGDLKPVPR